MASTAQAIGMDYTDFKQMLERDVWPEVSRRRHMSEVIVIFECCQ